MNIEWVRSEKGKWHKNRLQGDRYGLNSQHKAVCGEVVSCMVANFDGDQNGPGINTHWVCDDCARINVEVKA